MTDYKETKQRRADSTERKQARGDNQERNRSKMAAGKYEFGEHKQARGDREESGRNKVLAKPQDFGVYKKKSRGLSHEQMPETQGGKRAEIYDKVNEAEPLVIEIDGIEVDATGLDDEEIDALKLAVGEHEKDRQLKVEALGEEIAKKRSEAIKFRQNSGIEERWTEDEEFYEGIDDANRGESSDWSSKPPGRTTPDVDDTSSTIFLNITRPYCDAAGASLSDMLLPTDDDGWAFEPTAVPELIPGIVEGQLPKSLEREINADAQARGQNPEQLKQGVVQQAQEMLEEHEVAKEKARLTQERIKDWHEESQYAAEVRKVIEDAARIGTGILKGPFPEKRRQVAYKDGQLIIQEEIKPASRRIHYRNFYPAADCGDNIHNGSGVFERDDISAKSLRELIGVPGYDEKQIGECLEEGPLEAGKEFKRSDEMKRRDTKTLYEIWYYYGDLTKEEMEAAGCECEGDAAPAQVVMVNNRVIKVSLNPLDTGEFPYDIMVWQECQGMPWGMGVARHIRNPQKMINGATRNMMDNAGLAGGPMWAFKQGVLEPIDGVVEIAPRKGWQAAEDADIDDIQRAFAYFKLDIMINELMAIINFGLKMAEDVTGLPMIMQGQMGAQKLNTLGQTELLNNNANIVRRRIARSFDDRVTTPHLRRYHRFHLQYGPDDEKGEFVINALGSSNLVERAIQKEQITEVLSMSQNPVYGIDPKKAIQEFLRSLKFDPRTFEYDDDEWQQIVANLAQPQQSDPREAIAQLNAQVKALEIESRENTKAAELQSKERLQDKQFQFDAAMEQFQAAVDKELEKMKYEGTKDVSLDKLKVSLNETVMKLKTQKQLSAVNARAKNMPAPPTEPVGRAPAGESYQR